MLLYLSLSLRATHTHKLDCRMTDEIRTKVMPSDYTLEAGDQDYIIHLIERKTAGKLQEMLTDGEFQNRVADLIIDKMAVNMASRILNQFRGVIDEELHKGTAIQDIGEAIREKLNQNRAEARAFDRAIKAHNAKINAK